ncbi:MAG: DNA polymerase I, partial [Rickettsiales bacterium]|nr:DNA polymerase I [Rickettsiales bacterium]
KQASEAGQEVIIVSSDKDLMQLINDKVSMFDAMKNKTIGRDEVIEKFGLGPEFVIDIQALAGDSVDNVPGVPGIGVKTAAQLLEEFGDLETLLENAHTIKQNKRRENLIEFAEEARLSKKLVRLEDEVPVPLPLDELHINAPDPEKLLEFLTEQGFKSTISRIQNQLGLHAEGRSALLDNANANDNADEEAEYICIEDLETLKKWCDEAKQAGIVAVDTETTSLTPSEADLIGVSMSIHSGKAAYIPLGHKQKNVEMGLDLGGKNEEGESSKKYNQIPLEKALEVLKPMLEDESILKIAHNMKYDAQIFMQHDINVSPIDDTMLLSYVVDGTKHGHGLDALSEEFLGHTNISFKEIAGTGKNQKTFDEISIDQAIDYAAEDADMTRRLHSLFKPRIAQEKMASLYEDIERPLVNVLANMEFKGIKIDPLILKEMSNSFEKQLNELEEAIHKEAGTTFNVGSPKQLGEVLFGQMGLEGGKKSKSGTYSTAQNVLEPLAEQGHEIVQDVLEWRGLAKLKSTYTDALPNQINPKTGRVHTSFSMTTTNTGRLSSSDPNLQNIPIRTENGKKIRTAFIAEDGYKLVSMDYSQVELRLVAEMAGVETLKQAFLNDQDIHALTASHVFDTPLDQVSSDLRRKAKAINFGIIYGISGYGLAKQIGGDAGEANRYIKDYLARFPELDKFMEDQKEFARKHGYVKTLYGRHCVVNGIKDKNFSIRSFAERQAINAPIQGTAADIMKKAMIEVHKTIEDQDLPVKMLLQIHDELIFEIKEDDVERCVSLLKDVMENVCKLSIPLSVDAGIGDNWAQAH